MSIPYETDNVKTKDIQDIDNFLFFDNKHICLQKNK